MKIWLYPFNDISFDLSKQIDIEGFIDKDKVGPKVFKLENVIDQVDSVIICSPIYYKEIYNNLIKKKVDRRKICFYVNGHYVKSYVLAHLSYIANYAISFFRKDSLQEKSIDNTLEETYDLEFYAQFISRQKQLPNPLNHNRLFGFSQNEEDSITLEVLKRIGLKKGIFVEFGVGNGTENNTLILLAMGWKGYWIGGQNLLLDTRRSKRLTFTKAWVTRENIIDLFHTSKEHYVDVISLDLDGNDIYFAEALLNKGAAPKLFIVEYNGKFPPGVRFQIEYDDFHVWNKDDYFGASLQTFCDLFEQFGYMLVCCNNTGANAFFVKKEYKHLFNDIPNSIEKIYVEPFYFQRTQKMHPTSLKTLQTIIDN